MQQGPLRFGIALEAQHRDEGLQRQGKTHKDLCGVEKLFHEDQHRHCVAVKHPQHKSVQGGDHQGRHGKIGRPGKT